MIHQHVTTNHKFKYKYLLFILLSSVLQYHAVWYPPARQHGAIKWKTTISMYDALNISNTINSQESYNTNPLKKKVLCKRKWLAQRQILYIYTYLFNSKILKLFIMQFLHLPVTASPSEVQICPSLNLLSFRLRNQVSCPYRTTKIKDVVFETSDFRYKRV